jgi:hypothetical protein
LAVPADGAETTALAFPYAYGGAAIGSANCDVLDAWATAATTGVVVADASHDSEMLVCEVEASAMNQALSHDWLTIKPNGGTSGIAHIVAILKPRYGNNVSATALA